VPNPLTRAHDDRHLREAHRIAEGDERAEHGERDGVGDEVPEPAVQERGQRMPASPRVVRGRIPQESKPVPAAGR
jgi:hypothetical protein